MRVRPGGFSGQYNKFRNRDVFIIYVSSVRTPSINHNNTEIKIVTSDRLGKARSEFGSCWKHYE